MMVENVLGLSYDRPLLKMREYLEVLNPMLRGEAVEPRPTDLFLASLLP